jgi:hypothetical protein
MVGLVMLLALPTAALAVSRVLHGPAGPARSATVDIQFDIKNGHPTKITRLELNNIPASCQGGSPTATYYSFAHQISVSRKGTFHVKETASGGRATYAARGHFIGPYSRSKGPYKAVGTLRIKGPVTGCASADTGRVHWVANRT